MTNQINKILSEARTPHYDGTETKSWGDVDKTFETFLDNVSGDTEDVEQVGDLTSDQKQWMAAKSLLGDAEAETFDELVFFPVVNPNNKNLNKGALEAVRGGRGQEADIPESTYNSADAKAKQLLKDEFDVEYPEEEGIERTRVTKEFEFKEIEETDDETYTAVLSTESRDREGQVVVQNFEVEGFMENPVVLDSHKGDSIENIVGKVLTLNHKGDRLEGEIKFNDQPKGKMAQELIENGYLNAVSIGFLPKEFDDEDARTITEAELLELSVTAVPSNPEALIKSMDEQDVKDLKNKVEKESRVLSAQNKEDIEQAVEFLNNVLNRHKAATRDDNSTVEDEKPDVEENNLEEPDDETEEKTKSQILRKVMKDKKEKRKKLLNKIAENLNDANASNVNKKKRKVYKHLRNLKEEL